MSVRVLIVDDDLFVRESLADYLRTTDDMTLVGSCTDGLQSLHLVKEHTPDVVLMDVRMDRMSGIDATREITRATSTTRVLALTSFDDIDTIVDMLAAGASGYLLKSTRPHALLHAIRAVNDGMSVVPPGTLQRWAAGRSRRSRPKLTPREQQVLQMLDLGLTNRQIAARLYVSPSTVKADVAELMRKLDAPTRTRVVAQAHQLGMLSTSG
ncbi:MAG: response regulator transcription factor [Propionicimonas sp.]|uniref:response regulator n=1 Tax=Propionicimonas sp. TaxID=1955623 RepID=UPI003D0E603D